MAMDPVDWDSANPNLLINSFNGFGAGSQLIEILDIGDSGTTLDSTMVKANPNPTEPSTGTGVFQPFKRVQRSSSSCTSSHDCIDVNGSTVGTQNGFNTDTGEPNVNYDIVSGAWTRSVMMSELKITNGFIELQLDANQNGAAGSDENKLVISNLQIFIGQGLETPETGPQDSATGYTGTLFDGATENGGTEDPNQLLGLNARWELDNINNGNVDILLQASICDTPGQCGSGMGDMSIFIPVAELGSFNPDDKFVFYSEYLYVNDGFEEWRFGVNDGGGTGTPVAEPGTLAIFGLGIIGLGWARRRKRAAVTGA